MNHSFWVASLFGLSLTLSGMLLAEDPVSTSPDTIAQDQESSGAGDHEQILKRFDKNGDGHLGPREMAAAKEAKARLDHDRNGKVSKRELEAAKKAFDRADHNNDGQLGSRERAAAKQQREQAASKRQRQVEESKPQKGSPGTSSRTKSGSVANGQPANRGGQNSNNNGRNPRGGGKPAVNGTAQKSGPSDQPTTFSGLRAAAQRGSALGGTAGGSGGGNRSGGVSGAPSGGRPAASGSGRPAGGGGGGAHRR